MSETKDLEIIHRPRESSIVKADDFMPLLSVDQAVARKGQINEYVGRVLKEGEDYGKMPGDTRTGAKKVLLKPGAEKLCSIFGLAPQYLEDKIVEDWTGKDHGGEPLFYYSYRCQLMRGDRFMGESIGSANSWEIKYRYRWVTEEVLANMIDPQEALPEAEYRAKLSTIPSRGSKTSKFEPDFAIDKRAPEGEKYGHPAEYWDQFTAAAGAKRVTGRELGKRKYNGWEVVIDQRLYRIPNPDTPDVVNTLQKMAQKRALVAAVLVVTNCSDAFTQDLEDNGNGGENDEPENGRHKVDSGAAAPVTAVQETLPTAEPAIVLPEELAGLVGPDAPPKGTTTAFEICRRELKEALPDGDDQYRKILALNGIKEKGNKIEDIKKALIQCWTTAQSAKKAKGATAPATVEDAGPAKFGQADDWGPGRE